MKVDAEHFVDCAQADPTAKFEFSHNPFAKDIAGKTFTIENTKDEENKFVMSETLMLQPDISTLRVAPWLSNEVFIFADVYDDSGALVNYAPRNILKSAINKFENKPAFENVQINNLSL